ncbi:MAG TPA: cyanoexosortase A system-associated protein [Thermosynechococcaceae cyanobacterium]
MAKVQHPIRLAMLVVLLSGAIVVLGKAILTPKATQQAAAPAATLPTTVAIDGWQLTKTSALKDLGDKVPGQRYEYRSTAANAPVLEVDAWMMAGDGNISRFLFVHTPIREGNVKLQERQNADGVYAVLTHEGRAYLSACINPRGGATVTEQQFTQNHYRHDLQVGRLLPWLMGQESLLDARCIWTMMSVPIDPNQSNAGTSETAYKTLETAWVSWYRWWQPNFPPAPRKLR